MDVGYDTVRVGRWRSPPEKVEVLNAIDENKGAQSEMQSRCGTRCATILAGCPDDYPGSVGIDARAVLANVKAE